MSTALSRQLTSYDLIKAFAVVIMIIDHIGTYFFVDLLWFKAIGRIGFPIWFFLVGYSNGRQITRSLGIGALLLTAGNILAGKALFPLNALVTIISMRLVLDPLMRFLLKGGLARFWWLHVPLVLLIVPTTVMMEYGTVALAFGILGWIARHRHDPGIRIPVTFFDYSGFAFFFFIVVMQMLYFFSPPQLIGMTLGTAAVMHWITKFKPAEYKTGDGLFSRCGVAACQFMGRNTLEIYVIHLLMFKAAVLFLNPEKFLHFIWL